MLFRFFSCACVAVGLGLGSYGATNQPFIPQEHATHWVLQALDGKRLPNARPETRQRLVLPLAEASPTAHRQGSFRQSATARLLTIPHVISTMMRHTDQAVEVELRYLTVLEQSTRFEVTGTTLHLFAAGQTTPLATFQATQPM